MGPLRARAIKPCDGNLLTSATSANERGKFVVVANQRTSFAYATNHELLTGRATAPPGAKIRPVIENVKCHTVNIRLYITLAHMVAPAPAMHSCGAPCWDVVHRPCRVPDRALNQARSRGSLSQTGRVSTVDRVGNASITDLIARETATSCALLTGSNAKTRQTRSRSLRLSQGRGPLTPPPPSPRPDLPPPLPRYVSA